MALPVFNHYFAVSVFNFALGPTSTVTFLLTSLIILIVIQMKGHSFAFRYKM